MGLTTDTLELIEKKFRYDPREMMSRDKDAPRRQLPQKSCFRKTTFRGA